MGLHSRGGLFLALTTISLLIGSSWADARVYKYVDAAGQTHYTNEISSVPRGQRQQVKSKAEVLIPDAAGEEAAVEEGLGNNSEQITEPAQNREEEFRNRERTLTVEREGLLAERKELDNSRDLLNTAAGVLKYNRQVEDLNKKFEDLIKKRALFEKELQTYNQRVEVDLKNKLQQINEQKNAQKNSDSEKKLAP